jgi:hypothetical protein
LPERVRLKVESAEEDIRVLEYRSQAAGARRKMKTSQRRFLGLTNLLEACPIFMGPA